jgi:hypothetical protein
MITTGKRYTPKEIERYVDAVTPEEIQRVAQKYLWDKDVCFLSSFHLLSDEWWLTYSSLWPLLDEPRVSSITTESELVSFQILNPRVSADC